MGFCLYFHSFSALVCEDVIDFFDQMRPAGILGDEKVIKEIRVFAVLAFRFVVKNALLDLLLDDFIARGQENIRAAFQKVHSEDEILYSAASMLGRKMSAAA